MKGAWCDMRQENCVDSGCNFMKFVAGCFVPGALPHGSDVMMICEDNPDKIICTILIDDSWFLMRCSVG